MKFAAIIEYGKRRAVSAPIPELCLVSVFNRLRMA